MESIATVASVKNCFATNNPSGILARMDSLSLEGVRAAVQQALAEDLRSGDATTNAIISEAAGASAMMIARQPLTLAGLAFAEAAFKELASEVMVDRFALDGQRLETNGRLMRVAGPARALLSAERVALNFVQRLSGIATLTARFVEAIQGTQATILDTRKTTPGWRRFEKYAVACGGGRNHRLGLDDLLLIKDNHLHALRDARPNAISAAIRLARLKRPDLRVEVEADTREQVAQAVEAGADIILLDNMSLADLRASVQLVAGRAKTEASGGIQLSNVRFVAETGVDYISVGALTHSAPAVDIALDFE